MFDITSIESILDGMSKFCKLNIHLVNGMNNLLHWIVSLMACYQRASSPASN